MVEAVRTRLQLWVAALACLAALEPLGAASQPTPASPPTTTSTAAATRLGPASDAEVQARLRKSGRPYLSSATRPDAVVVLPPPPAPGSLEGRSDLAIYRATRALEGTPRWALAARDSTNFFGAFNCVLGLTLSPETTPRTFALLLRVAADAGAEVNAAKDAFARPRPYIGNTLPICVDAQRNALSKSYSYPSGHATYAWAAGLVLSEADPARTAPLMARARAFGESRVVCGVHYLSDVRAGELAGAALVAALDARPDFRADVEAARAELAAVRSQGAATPGADCPVEAAAMKSTPWSEAPAQGAR